MKKTKEYSQTINLHKFSLTSISSSSIEYCKISTIWKRIKSKLSHKKLSSARKFFKIYMSIQL